MGQSTKPTEILLEGIDKYYNNILKLIKYLCIAFVIPTIGFLVWKYLKFGNVSNTISLFSIFLLLGIIFVFLSIRKNRRKIELQYFIENPDSLINYEIITGEAIKLSLISENNKITFPLKLTSLQIEEAIFKVFPNLEDKKKDQEFDKYINEPVNTNKAKLITNIPIALKPYFKDKFSSKLGCLPFIFGILIIGIVLSVIGNLGWYNIFIFKVGNPYWGYLLLPLLAFSFAMFYSNSNDKKVHDLMKTPENVIWIYLQKTKSNTTTTSTNLIIADVNGKYSVVVFEKQEETLQWLSLYCSSSVVGFYYEWDEIYEKNPKEFLNLIAHN